MTHITWFTVGTVFQACITLIQLHVYPIFCTKFDYRYFEARSDNHKNKIMVEFWEILYSNRNPKIQAFYDFRIFLSKIANWVLKFENMLKNTHFRIFTYDVEKWQFIKMAKMHDLVIGLWSSWRSLDDLVFWQAICIQW